MESLPVYISALFICSVALTLGWIAVAANSVRLLIPALGWTIFQSALALGGYFHDTTALPPPLMLYGVLPSLAVIAVMFLTQKGRAFIDSFDLKVLTYFHSIRVPVEIVLALLYAHGVMSVLITFEGTNFDILSGISAPLIAYYAFKGGATKTGIIWTWNVFALLLLMNVVVTSVFAVPSPIQRLAFEQPNVAVLHFPFSLLPTVVVPLVFFAHLVAFRKLTSKSSY